MQLDAREDVRRGAAAAPLPVLVPVQPPAGAALLRQDDRHVRRRAGHQKVLLGPRLGELLRVGAAPRG